MRDEHRRESALVERVHDVERLRRGVASNSISSFACSSRSNASASPCGDSQSAAAKRLRRTSAKAEGINAAASGPITNMSACCRKPPTRVNSTSAAAIQTAASCATTHADEHARAQVQALQLCRRAAGGARHGDRRPRGPRPAASERGWPSRITYSFGLTTWPLPRARERSSARAAPRRAEAPSRPPSPSRPGRVPVRRDGR